MPTKEEIINTFVHNFILKDKRERSHMLLLNKKKRSQFTDKLNHQWERMFDMKYLTQLESNYNYSKVVQLLKMRNDELCYVISDIGECDDVMLPFKQAFSNIDYSGFGAVLVNATADKIYLVTEAMQGGTPRFVGRR